MTDTHPSRTGADRNEADEVARLLPPPPEWDLAPERKLHHKERLMRQIDDDTVRAAETAPAPARRRVLRPAFVAPVAALALAGTLTAGLTRGGEDHGGGTGTTRAGGSAHARQASALLGRISDAALDGRPLSVRDDQFVYVKSQERGADETSGKAVMGPPVVRESWATQDPGRVRHIALLREDGETYWNNAFLGDEGGTPVGIDRPTYEWLAALPTDPDALLTYLYAKTPEQGRSRDQAVFERIGNLASGLLPPRTAAALYRAAARIPGVVTAPDAHDGKGRTGIGIAREDKKHAERSEWVFDKDLRFLGSRTYLTEDRSVGRKGTLLASTAVLALGVADKAGVRPAEVTEVTGDGGAEQS
ncbi:CU044_5270 family protein [Streptomyces sp. NPDC004959]|uniref:CU044_5270 family protein n=1 Tax=unclassified Streptomyces TaxID=2593676 RepID=UPI0004C5A1F9|nr:CU044_5270 family protein [Streptomyces sp. NRRL F-5630]